MKSEIKKIERPKIKDYFKESVTLQDVIKVYKSNPELFEYTQELDRHIDQIEQERDGLKANIKEILRMEKISLSNVPLWLLTKLEALIK